MNQNQEAHIILDKELRRDIDAIIQRLREPMKPFPNTNFRSSVERHHALTKLQEAVMWLGMDLKAINEENQPHEAEVEALAKTIYDEMRANDPEGRGKPWEEGGNSLKQSEARQIARTRLSPCANPYPNSKDPSNTKIEPTADGLKM